MKKQPDLEQLLKAITANIKDQELRSIIELYLENPSALSEEYRKTAVVKINELLSKYPELSKYKPKTSSRVKKSALAIIVASLLVSSGFSGYRWWRQTQEVNLLQNRLSATVNHEEKQQNNISDASTSDARIRDLEEKLAQEQEKNARELQEEKDKYGRLLKKEQKGHTARLKEEQKKYSALEQSLNEEKAKSNSFEARINELMKKIADYETLKSRITSMEKEISDYKSEVDKAKREKQDIAANYENQFRQKKERIQSLERTVETLRQIVDEKDRQIKNLRDVFSAREKEELKKRAKALYGQGQAYLLNKKLFEAITAFSEALRLNPNFPGAHYGLGLAYRDTGNLERAVEEYKKETQTKKVLIQVTKDDNAIISYRAVLYKDSKKELVKTFGVHRKKMQTVSFELDPGKYLLIIDRRRIERRSTHNRGYLYLNGNQLTIVYNTTPPPEVTFWFTVHPDNKITIP